MTTKIQDKPNFNDLFYSEKDKTLFWILGYTTSFKIIKDSTRAFC